MKRPTHPSEKCNIIINLIKQNFLNVFFSDGKKEYYIVYINNCSLISVSIATEFCMMKLLSYNSTHHYQIVYLNYIFSAQVAFPTYLFSIITVQYFSVKSVLIAILCTQYQTFRNKNMAIMAIIQKYGNLKNWLLIIL